MLTLQGGSNTGTVVILQPLPTLGEMLQKISRTRLELTTHFLSVRRICVPCPTDHTRKCRPWVGNRWIHCQCERKLPAGCRRIQSSGGVHIRGWTRRRSPAIVPNWSSRAHTACDTDVQGERGSVWHSLPRVVPVRRARLWEIGDLAGGSSVVEVAVFDAATDYGAHNVSLDLSESMVSSFMPDLTA